MIQVAWTTISTYKNTWTHNVVCFEGDMGDFFDDVLIQVLLWLPVKLLFRMKCVSKRWCNVISSDDFRKVYQSQIKAQDDSISSLLGFFRLEAEDAFLPVSSGSSTNTVCFSKLNGRKFIGSSNGLLLYHHYDLRLYSICNPVTSQWRYVSQPHSSSVKVAIGFDVEDQKCNSMELKFKLVWFMLPSPKSSTLQMKIFSSKSGWGTESNLRVSGNAGISFRAFEFAMIIKEAYYWLDLKNRVLTYDSSGSQGHAEHTVEVIGTPAPYNQIADRAFVLGESKDGLLQYGKSDCYKIVIWVLKVSTLNGVNQLEWIYTHTVSFMLMRRQFPDIMSSCDLILSHRVNERCVDVPELVAFHPLDSGTVFLQLNKMIISYCFDDGKLKLVCRLQGKGHKLEDGSSSDQLRKRSNRIIPYFTPTWAAFHL